MPLKTAVKRCLLLFITQYITCSSSDFLKEHERLIIAGGFENPTHVFLITTSQNLQLEELASNHYEADTRIILHVLSEAKQYKKILVRSVDTDILLLLLHYYTTSSTLNMCKLFIELGRSNTKRYISITDLSKKLGRNVCTSLLSMHALTGCDTTSAFYKIGKRTAFDILIKYIEAFKQLSTITTVTEEYAFEIASEFIIKLYKPKKTNIRTLNELRLYLTQYSNKPASELPPTDDAFLQHLKRYDLT